MLKYLYLNSPKRRKLWQALQISSRNTLTQITIPSLPALPPATRRSPLRNLHLSERSLTDTGTINPDFFVLKEKINGKLYLHTRGCTRPRPRSLRYKMRIHHKGNHRKYNHKNATDGDKTIFYCDIIGIQFKKSGFSIGYLQLETGSGQMNNDRSNFFSENTFTFEHGKGGLTNEIMEKIHDCIVDRFEEIKYGVKILEEVPDFFAEAEVPEQTATYYVAEEVTASPDTPKPQPKKTTWVCRQCGASNPQSSRMCQSCGAYK